MRPIEAHAPAHPIAKWPAYLAAIPALATCSCDTSKADDL
jgi:hypothetical protein